MCGIAGFLRFDGQPVDRDRLVGMAKAIAHRGPDGEGFWTDGPIGLAHRRLAIIDLSETGAQPMASADGRLHIVFNGEIYNYQSLKTELASDGRAFRSSSDTEILLHLYERDGEKMLAKLHGMFAFAIWDAQKSRLFFARDRLGKKPFFYQQDDHRFAFASELKALISDERPEIDWLAVRSFLGLQYVPSPQTGFKGIFSLPAGHCGSIENGHLSVRRYDDLPREPKFAGSFEEAAKRLRILAEDAVRLRLVADVPVGAFLSGGVDSSIVAALMAKERKGFPTFTMGFPSLNNDERPEARWFAKQIGSDHHEFEARPENILDLVDVMVSLYDAPYADSSCLPTWLLARETSAHVKVVLAGDGGDELFGGYRRYRAFLKAAKFKWALGSTIARQFISVAFKQDPRFLRFVRTVEGLRNSFGHGYAALFTGSYFTEADESDLLQPDFLQSTHAAEAEEFIVKNYDEKLGLEGALAFDLSSYLVDDLNVKMDRAAMAHGLEVRVPFLDQELAKFSVQLPLSYVLTNGASKRILRTAFADVIPPEIFDRPKRGFQVPLAQWFRKELRPLFVENCVQKGSRLHSVCRTETVEKYLKENDRGADHGNRLWMLLVLALWLNKHV